MSTRPLTLCASVLFLGPAAASAQQAPQPQYTAAQAEAGKEIFGRVCAVCHSADLTGGPIAPPLSGAYFASNWSGSPVTSLFEFVTTEMPQTAPGSLDEESYVRLVSYVLSFNGVPAGTMPLTVSDPGVITVTTKD